MHTAKYKNNPKDAKKDKRLLFINPLNIEYKNKENIKLEEDLLWNLQKIF